MSDYLQSIQLVSMGDDKANDDTVKLLSMHSSKGMEWPCVNLIGVENGCIPHSRAVSERGQAEERRLMYVGITRSRNHLSVSYCHVRRGKNVERSIFIDEMLGSK